MNSQVPKIFLSYSHTNEKWKDKIQKFLNVQVNRGKFTTWDDRDIRITEKWHSKIEEAILDSDIALLFVTNDFLLSDFIQNKEVPFILKNNLKIAPIIISPCTWRDVEYISSAQGLTKNNNELAGLSDYEQDVAINNMVQELVSLFSVKEASKVTSTREYIPLMSLQEDAVDFLERNSDIALIQSITLKYLPERYSEPIPPSVLEIIELLNAYGQGTKNIPILCVLNELVKKYDYPSQLKEYFEYLKDVQFRGVEYECYENRTVKERAFLIEFLKQEKNKFSIQMWEHINNEFTQNNLFLPDVIELNDKGIKSFFNQLFNFFNQIRYKGVEIYLEIILPIEKLSKGIKEWKYIAKRNREKRVISKYKYILRIQERFREMDINWENKWDSINHEYSIIDNEHILLSAKYNDDISGVNLCVLSNTKVDKIQDVFYDIDENSIPIALLHLSENIDKEGYNNLCNETVKSCKSKITNFICTNHNNDNSDMIFLFDNPNKVPQQFRENIDFQYGQD